MKATMIKMRSAVNWKQALLNTVAALAFGILALGLVSPGMAFQAPAGQEGGHGEGHRGMHNPGWELGFLTRKLNLTQDQQAKIKPILEAQHKQMMALREDSSFSRDQKRPKFMEIRKNTTQQIQAVLQPDQVTKFRQMQERRQQRMKAWRESHGAEGTGSAPQNQ